FFHHLSSEAKRSSLAAIRRMLTAGGELHIADWGQARGFAMRVAFLAVQALDGFATTTENVRSGLVPVLKETGFESVAETARNATMLGTMSLYRAVAPQRTE